MQPGVAGTINLLVRTDGSFLLNGQQVREDQLEERIRQAQKKSELRIFVFVDDYDAAIEMETIAELEMFATKAGIPFELDVLRRVSPQWDHFEAVGHSLFTLLIALAGGVLAVWCFGERGKLAKVDE